MRALVRLGRGLRVEHDLHEAGAIAQVDEHQAAVVAAAVHPARHADLVFHAGGRDLAAPACRGRGWDVAAAAGNPAQRARRSNSSRSPASGTSCWSRRVMSRTAAADRSHSCGPMITTQARPSRSAWLHLGLQRARSPRSMRRADALLAQLGHRPEHARPRLRLADDEEELRPAPRAASSAASPRASASTCSIRSSPVRPPVARRRRGRRAARSAGRSGRRRRPRSARRARRSGTRRPCACSSRGRAPAAGRARSRCRRRRAAPHLLEVLAIGVVEPLDHLRRRLRDRGDLRRVPVEGAHRVDLDPRALIGVEHVVAEQERRAARARTRRGSRGRRCSSGAAARRAMPSRAYRCASRSISSASTAGSSDPIVSAPIWLCWR